MPMPDDMCVHNMDELSMMATFASRQLISFPHYFRRRGYSLNRDEGSGDSNHPLRVLFHKVVLCSMAVSLMGEMWLPLKLNRLCCHPESNRIISSVIFPLGKKNPKHRKIAPNLFGSWGGEEEHACVAIKAAACDEVSQCELKSRKWPEVCTPMTASSMGSFSGPAAGRNSGHICPTINVYGCSGNVTGFA
jgi:hypothetical protein